MKELSLNVLDIAKNSVKAGAALVQILLKEEANTLTMEILDDGCGMTADFLESVTNPFCTTRTTRRVGMGIPLLKLAAEQTGGSVTIRSTHESVDPINHGTDVVAVFRKDHIDFTPMGDIISSVITLIQGNPQTDFLFRHETEQGTAALDTRQLREILGDDVPLDSFEVLAWIEDYLREQYNNFQQ